MDWSEKALLCSHVLIEVELSGVIETFRREVTEQLGSPLEIYGGSYEVATSATVEQWKKYPYRRSPSTMSFSQAIFQILGMPEVLNDVSGNITIHQVLRLLYADQLSPVEDLFRFERFEQAVLRDTIGRLLCGAYADDLYNNDQKIKALSKEFDAIESELRGIFSILDSNFGEIPTMEWVHATKNNLLTELKNLNEEVEGAELRIYSETERGEFTMQEINAAYGEVQRLQSDLVSAQNNYEKVDFDIADSNRFIESLKRKIISLRDASTTARNFGTVKFHSCPACYTVVEEKEDEAEHCHLCKSPFDADKMRDRIAALINETAVQLKQSEILQNKRLSKRDAINNKIRELTAAWKHASKKLAALKRLPTTKARQNLRELDRKIGYVERQIEDLDRQNQLMSRMHELTDQKSKLNYQIGRLKIVNEAMIQSQRNRLTQAYTQIATEVKALLSSDLRRQDAFEDPKSVQFTFAGNKITVDGQSYFSASSRAILKSSFCLGFMAAAAKNPMFRHPRFAMIDVLENMGVEQIRSQHFQRQIARLSAELPSEHQIIYATAMIAPDLDDETYTVGRYSTRDKPTLAFVGQEKI